MHTTELKGGQSVARIEATNRTAIKDCAEVVLAWLSQRAIQSVEFGHYDNAARILQAANALDGEVCFLDRGDDDEHDNLVDG